MNISEIVSELLKIKEEHGDIPVGFDDYNQGHGGTCEVGVIEVKKGEILIGGIKPQTFVKLS